MWVSRRMRKGEFAWLLRAWKCYPPLILRPRFYKLPPPSLGFLHVSQNSVQECHIYALVVPMILVPCQLRGRQNVPILWQLSRASAVLPRR